MGYAISPIGWEEGEDLLNQPFRRPMRQSAIRRARTANPPTAPPTIAPVGVEFLGDGEEEVIGAEMMVVVVVAALEVDFEGDVEEGFSEDDIDVSDNIVDEDEAADGVVSVSDVAGVVVGLLSTDTEVVGESVVVSGGISADVSVGVVVMAGAAVVIAAEFPTYIICNGFGCPVFSLANDVATVVPSYPSTVPHPYCK